MGKFEEVKGVGGLRMKLRELENKRDERAAYQLKVDEDIRALKRTMEIMAVA